MNDLIYWIWLSLSATPDTATFKKLMDFYPGAKEIYQAEIFEISKHIGSRSSDRAALENKDLTRANEIFEYCQKHDIGIVAYPDEKYPQSLREIKTPPVLLYYRGTLPDFNKRFSLSIVGTRSLSNYGKHAAFNAGYEMALAGAVIVSGMAMGIDGVSHAGALSAGGTTVAVIGSGINICYPEGHKTLAKEIVKNGCVITEFAPGVPPTRYTFPKRNRIISGLSAATLVIEGKERSGSLITARHAREQGRTVYALPGNVGVKNSEATNLLIKNGAKLFTSSDDIIKDFSDSYPGQINPFLLPEKINCDINGALCKYSVIAVTPDDDVFVPSKPKKEKARKQRSDVMELREEKVDDTPAVENLPPEGFDKKALSVYKKIPPIGDCLIDSLVDNETDMRTIMQSLLKLELGHFIELCPGERVKRKTKG